MRVTIVPEDKTVIVDGAAITMDKPGGVAMPLADLNWHAIQFYDDGHAVIENKKGGATWVEGTDAAALITPFLDAHAAEVARLASIPVPPPPTPEQRATAGIMAPAAQAILQATLERQEAKAAPATPADKDAINARAVEIMAAQILV